MLIGYSFTLEGKEMEKKRENKRMKGEAMEESEKKGAHAQRGAHAAHEEGSWQRGERKGGRR